MEDYKVDIRLPRDDDKDPTKVAVSGDQVNNVLNNIMLTTFLTTVLTTVLTPALTPALPQIAGEDCMDHMKLLEEEIIKDAA